RRQRRPGPDPAGRRRRDDRLRGRGDLRDREGGRLRPRPADLGEGRGRRLRPRDPGRGSLSGVAARVRPIPSGPAAPLGYRPTARLLPGGRFVHRSPVKGDEPRVGRWVSSRCRRAGIATESHRERVVADAAARSPDDDPRLTLSVICARTANETMPIEPPRRSDRRRDPAPLYDPAFEHDACGIGFVADAGGKRLAEVLPLALRGLAALAHRGAFGADGASSDGAGVSLPLTPSVFASLDL